MPSRDLARFGGRLCVRFGWFWVPATPADLERIEADRRARIDALWWLASASLAALAASIAVVLEVLR